jgi:hypothetical protein
VPGLFRLLEAVVRRKNGEDERERESEEELRIWVCLVSFKVDTLSLFQSFPLQGDVVARGSTMLVACWSK